MKVKNILRVHESIMDWRVMLGEVIGKVISPTTPMDVKFPLAFTII